MQSLFNALQKAHDWWVGLFLKPLLAIPLTVVCFLALFLGVDPVGSFLDPKTAPATAMVTTIALFLGYTAYSMLQGSSDEASISAEQIAKNLGWPLAVVMGILAFGTSLPEGCSVFVGVQNGDTQFIYQAIVGSDFYQAAFLFPLCILFADRRTWSGERLRWDMILTSCMTGCIAIAPTLGVLGTMLAGVALLFAISAFIQFNIDTPQDGIVERIASSEENQEGVSTWKSIYRLVFPGFGILLLGSNYMYISVHYLVNVLKWPEFLKGFFVAISSSAGEMFTTLPKVAAGVLPLSMVSIALLGSNVCDTTFMLLGALYLSLTGNPMTLDNSIVNILPGLCTMIVTVAITVMTFRQRLSSAFAYTCMVIYFGCFVGQIFLG